MNIIDKVRITEFWGDREVFFIFNSDINFLIGVNGSGKTTIINMIAAALTADFHTLDKLPFKKIEIELSEVGGRKKPSIMIKKLPSKKSSYQNIEYKIKEKASEPYVTYSLNEYEEEMFMHRWRPPSQYLMKLNRGLVANLRSIVNVSWLSIHRANITSDLHEESSYESSVDQKLSELSNSLIKYFSALASKVRDEIEEFQKNIIVSLLTEKTQNTVFSLVKRLNLEQEKNSIKDIFDHLKIDKKGTSSSLDKHFKAVGDAISKMEMHEGLMLPDLMSVTNSFRIHRVVLEWNSFLEKQKQILKPMETFLSVLNGLYQRKKMVVNENNELTAITKSGKQLSINNLSSGEKQLLIIIGEALLQNETPWVYIADEPELSLHVAWQEKLVENLRRINPKAQIICATHSPDIVSVFSDKVFDMETIIK